MSILDLVYKLFKYDTDGNNALLESSDNALSESITKISSIYDENLKVTIQGYVRWVMYDCVLLFATLHLLDNQYFSQVFPTSRIK